MNARVSPWITLVAAASALARETPPMIVPDLASRLAALEPRDPLAYFELAEELAQEASDDRARSIAQTLFVLAHELDRSSPHPTGLARSAYLALAAMADTADDRRWLLALAGRTGPADQSTTDTDASRLLLAQAIGDARAGDPHEVKETLAKEGVQSLLDAPGSSFRRIRPLLERVQAEGLCPGCRGRRTVRSVLPTDDGSREEALALCPVCRGNPGPRLGAEEFARSLAVESDLLGAEHGQWGAQTWLDLGAPLRDADPALLAPRFNVDAAAVYWSSSGEDPLEGRWVMQRSESR